MLRRAVVGLLRLYQLASPTTLRGACRFAPTCSEYTRQAIDRHGLIRGGLLAVRRLLRCHPLGAHGFDPVP